MLLICVRAQPLEIHLAGRVYSILLFYFYLSVHLCNIQPDVIFNNCKDSLMRKKHVFNDCVLNSHSFPINTVQQ